MPELRLNLITREWVIIATERAKRPEDFKTTASRKESPPYVETCPFCPGNESKTPGETFRISGDETGWKARVVPNRFSAVSASGNKERRIDGLIRNVTAVGVHEVIIESPLHNTNPALLSLEQMEDVVKIYKNRFMEAYKDPRVEHVIIFKNHGEGAGTSLEHPHSQIIGTPVTPVQFRDRLEAAAHFFDDTGECLMCMLAKKEKEDGVRVITETEHFLAFVPYAALSPFHTWIFPKRHSASFGNITEAEIKDLALSLKNILSKLYHGLTNPDYNFVIRSNKPKDCDLEYFHWYVSIIPRVSKAAGFELGSGMYINTSLPEESAGFLRKVKTA
ncbi:MAG: galactose-1-phosphate uridylyltransferase [Deltaproteobacteria bacterium]|nr:galactose-1-phosphate uridylyltransferase [Deltaproteobacteria bacterium]